MNKATFTYTKSDGTSKNRLVLEPKFIKESYNSYKEFDKDQVKYLQGYEIEVDGLNQGEIDEYKEAVKDYFDLVVPTLEEFLRENDLDPNKVKYKTFKKENISELHFVKGERFD